MTLLCVCCPTFHPDGQPRLPNNPQVCDGCRRRLATRLSEIPTNLNGVYAHILPGRTGGERRTRGFESRAPFNLNAYSLIGAGWDTPLARLDFWVQDWARERRESTPDPTVRLLCGWLANRIDWACDHHPAVDEFTMDIIDITRSLRPFQPRTTGEPAGTCPVITRDNTPCNARLYVDAYVDVIACNRCGTSWHRRKGEWLHLRSAQSALEQESA